MGLVPCPNNGACGSRSHNQKSARYRECLASARFSGRGTSVSGMIVPKTSSPGNLDIPLSNIRGYEDRVTAQGHTGDIEVWRGWYDGQIRAEFQVKADLGKQLEAAGYVYDANDHDDVLDARDTSTICGTSLKRSMAWRTAMFLTVVLTLSFAHWSLEMTRRVR